MATLHQSAQTARQLVLTLLVGGLIFAIGKVAWDIGWQVYREKNPIPIAAPETRFGRLPNANIGQGIIPEIPFRYIEYCSDCLKNASNDCQHQL